MLATFGVGLSVILHVRPLFPHTPLGKHSLSSDAVTVLRNKFGDVLHDPDTWMRALREPAMVYGYSAGITPESLDPQLEYSNCSIYVTR